MGKKVFANGMEVAHKSGDAKVLAAFPDVCLSPPPPPTGPVPVPYPNTSFAKDLKEGSTTVKIGGKPLALQGQSYYATSPLGNEAATRNFGGAVITHTITGKTYFQAHSMNVKVEGKYVCRHLDITTCNHASYPGSTPPGANLEAINLALERIAQKKCPCCGKEDCPAAFKEGEEAQSFDDFHKINEPHPSRKTKFKGKLSDRGERRSKRIAEIRADKAAKCKCTPGNRVFPEPPCDVFRPPDEKRTAKIENKWNESRDAFRADWAAKNGRPLPTPDDAMASMRAAAGGSFGSDKEIKAALDSANKQTRINHLVPKEAGGCPDNPGNLQPQSELCDFCKGVDDQFTYDSMWKT